MNGKHHIDAKITDDILIDAIDAMSMARVTGSRGSTHIHQGPDGQERSITVEAIQVFEAPRYPMRRPVIASSCAWRIADHDTVIVASGAPGRYRTHTAEGVNA